MTAQEYLDSLSPDRKELLSQLRDLLLKHDKNVTEKVTTMMGKPMLVYEAPGGIFKYGLASVKTHMSFHSMIMYGSTERSGGSGLRERYERLLPDAKFQKACINFNKADQMPLEVVEKLFIESAAQEYPPAIYRERMLKSRARQEAAQKPGMKKQS